MHGFLAIATRFVNQNESWNEGNNLDVFDAKCGKNSGLTKISAKDFTRRYTHFTGGCTNFTHRIWGSQCWLYGKGVQTWLMEEILHQKKAARLQNCKSCLLIVHSTTHHLRRGQEFLDAFLRVFWQVVDFFCKPNYGDASHIFVYNYLHKLIPNLSPTTSSKLSSCSIVHR